MTENLTYPEYIGQDAAADLDHHIMRIGEALTNRRAQFLFGAGMSRSSELPTGVEVLESLLDTFFPSGGKKPDHQRLKLLAKEFPFEAVLEAILLKLGNSREELTNALKNLLTSKGKKPSQAHRDFVSLCWEENGRPRLSRVFTTNFDDLIEQEFGDNRAVLITEENAKQIRETRDDGLIPVLHLHGVLEKNYQATETDVYNSNQHILYKEFETALYYADAFVFVGYSMADPDFRHVYLRHRESIKFRENIIKNSTFVVSPPDDEFSYNLGKHVWYSRGAIWIPLKAENFFKRLKYLIEARYYDEVRKEVKKHYSLEDDKALDDRIQITAEIMRLKPAEALLFLHEALPQGGGR